MGYVNINQTKGLLNLAKNLTTGQNDSEDNSKVPKASDIKLQDKKSFIQVISEETNWIMPRWTFGFKWSKEISAEYEKTVVEILSWGQRNLQ